MARSRSDINWKLRVPLNDLADGLSGRYRNALLDAAGMKAKEIAKDEVIRDFGGDMRMSGVRSKAKLSSGYDIEGDDVLFKLRPKGLWNLANWGRQNKKYVRDVYYAPRSRGRTGRQGRRSNSTALRTPWGLKDNVAVSTTSGHGTTKRVDDRLSSDELREAMSLELGRIISKIT